MKADLPIMQQIANANNMYHVFRSSYHPYLSQNAIFPQTHSYRSIIPLPSMTLLAKILIKSSLNTLGKQPNNPTPVSRIQCQHIVLHGSITALNTINLDISRATLLGRFAHRLQDLAVLVPGVKGGCIKGRDLLRDIVVGRDQGGEVI